MTRAVRMNDLRCIVTTFEKEEQATDVVRKLVRERLVACGTSTRGARSIYVWNGALQDAEEIQVVLKTTADKLPAAARRLRELHPYDCPEILALAPECLNPDYEAWIRDSLAG